MALMLVPGSGFGVRGSLARRPRAASIPVSDAAVWSCIDVRYIDDDAGQRCGCRAARGRARRRRDRQGVWNAVSQCVERRNWNGDGNEAHRRLFGGRRRRGRGRGDLAAEHAERRFQVVPGFALVPGAAQEIRRMERRDQLGAAILEHAAAQPARSAPRS